MEFVKHQAGEYSVYASNKEGAYSDFKRVVAQICKRKGKKGWRINRINAAGNFKSCQPGGKTLKGTKTIVLKLLKQWNME